MPAWKFWLPITPVHVLVLFFHLQPFQKNPAQQILPKCCHMDAFSPKFHLTCLALCLEGFLFLNILNILEYFICRPCLGFYFNIIPYSNQFPSLNHHIGIKDTHTFSGSSTLLLPITDFSTDQNLQLSHSSPKSFKTRIWNVWHNLTPIEYLADSSSHGQHWVVPLTSMKCGCTASPPADQGSIPCLQIPGKPLSWWIINIPRCLQRCRAAAVLPTVLWQEIFYPPAAVPTFPECLGSVKAGFLTLHLAWAPGRGTNRLTAGAVWPAPLWLSTLGWAQECPQHRLRCFMSKTLSCRLSHSMAQRKCRLKSALMGFEHQTPTKQRDPTRWKVDQKSWIHVSTPSVFPTGTGSS